MDCARERRRGNHVHREECDAGVHAGLDVFWVAERIGDTRQVGPCRDAINTRETDANNVLTSQCFGSGDNGGTSCLVFRIMVVGGVSCTGFDEDLESCLGEFLHA